MAGRYKDSSEFMNWYNNLNETEKKEHNRKRWEREKTRLELQGKSRIKDKELSVCKALYKRAYDIPYCLVDQTTRPKELSIWYKEHKGGKCRYCGGIADSIDHIMPLSKGGKHTLSNLQIICWHCNRAKNSFTPEEWDTWRKNISFHYTEDGNKPSKVDV